MSLNEQQSSVYKFLKSVIINETQNKKEVLDRLFSLRNSPDKHENKIYEAFGTMDDEEWIEVRDKVLTNFDILLK